MTHFVLPDLVAHFPYPLRLNPHRTEETPKSIQWISKPLRFTPKREAEFRAAKYGELTAGCYPQADKFHLRAMMDLMNWSFAVDDWTDEFSIEGSSAMAECCIRSMCDPINFQTNKMVGILTKSWFTRLAQKSHPSVIKRFVRNMKLTFETLSQETVDRVTGQHPNLETYLARRRRTAGADPFLQCIEITGGFCLPDDVIQRPMIQSLEEAAVNYSAWINDIYSYRKEALTGVTYNLVAVVMREKGLKLQEAMDYAGELCNTLVDRFERDSRRLPSWGPEIDEIVAKYVVGMQDWMAGNLHWSFSSERYFGKDGSEIKRSRIVQLQLPAPVRQARLEGIL